METKPAFEREAAGKLVMHFQGRTDAFDKKFAH